MNCLSLFSGGEGGGLAFQHLIKPKITCIGYVEIDEYCQRIIRQRQIDGLLDKAPIYGDIRTFIDSGCAELYRGITDVITAGFPCQPFSVAGKRKGEQDDRNMWPWTIATIRLVRPQFAFLENVPGLLASGYMPRIFADLAKAGYDARWTVLGADDVGARHRRKRLWILAHSGNGNDRGWDRSHRKTNYLQKIDRSAVCSRKFGRTGKMAYANNSRSRTPRDGIDQNGQAKNEKREGQPFSRVGGQSKDISDTEIKTPVRGNGELSTDTSSEYSRTGQKSNGWWWSAEPALGRVAHGVANRVDRIKAIGNGQVPQVAALAWEILSN